MICEACGESNRPGTEFCAYCGSYLAWDPAVAPTTAPERTVREAAPSAQPRPPIPAPAPVASAAPAAPAPRPAATPVAAPPPVSPPAQPPPPVAVAENVEAPCPACGRLNPPSRRFCAKCGHQLLGDAPPARAAARSTSTQPGSWWSRRFDNRDRAARREYRRSLPALYRWRRVLVILGLLAGLVAGLAVAGRDPVGFVVARYHDVLGTLEPVEVTSVTVDPPDRTAPKSDPSTLIDRRESAWTMRWPPTTTEGQCGGAPGTGVILLGIPATRVRALRIRAGLPATDGRRLLQARPTRLGVTFGDGTCQALELTDAAEAQELPLDSQVPVDSIRIGIDRVISPGENGEPALSITEIEVLARP